ncbi:hypothetical protein AB4622_26745 [Vibrio splendidus]
MIEYVLNNHLVEIMLSYWMFVYVTKLFSYKYLNRHRDIRSVESKGILSILLSSDYWFSRYFKLQIIQNVFDKKGRLVELFNQVNLALSFCIFFALIFVWQSWHVPNILISLVVIRCVSRSFEISYAFLMDVIYQKSNTSNLDKFHRIRLALSSYIEIYVLYASVYFVFDPSSYGLEALVKSLGVGTFTNVSAAFQCSSDIFTLLVYGQVFTTLILVLMSLAVYVGRSE